MTYFIWYSIYFESFLLIKIKEYPYSVTAIIHIGSSKAASTFIQSHFQTISDFDYFGINFNMHKFKNQGVGHTFLNKDCQKLTNVLNNLDRFKGLDPQLKQNIQKKVKLANDQNKIFFYSCENLCESPSMYLMMEIFKEIFNDFKILYIVRNQFDIINSLYRFEGHKSSHLIGKQKFKYISFSDFFNQAVYNDKRRGGHKSTYWIHDYIRIYNYYQNICILSKFISEENILVYPFEDIEKLNDFNQILKFIGKKINKNISFPTSIRRGSLEPLNVSNKKNSFFKLYAFLSALNINPKKLNSKVRNFVNYKKLIKNSSNFKIEDKYFFEIKKLFLEDNLKLIEKFDTLKDYKSKYLFEK